MLFMSTSGFASSIVLNTWSNNIYRTDQYATINSGIVTPVQFVDTTSCIINGTSAHVREVPNTYSTFKSRISSSSGNVTIMNGELRVCGVNNDLPDIANGPTGVVVALVETVNTGIVINSSASGHATWQTPSSAYPDNMILFVNKSAGSGGLAPQGSSTATSIHENFWIMSIKPTVAGTGQKYSIYEYAEYFSLVPMLFSILF